MKKKLKGGDIKKNSILLIISNKTNSNQKNMNQI